MSALRPFLLRLHRWAAIVFALPLAILVLSGLMLSFEPAAQILSRDASGATSAKIAAALARHDSAGAARRLQHRGYENSLEIVLPGARPLVVDLATLEPRPGLGGLARAFEAARALHMTLMLDLRWLVAASTAALLVLVVLGLAMGLPRVVASWSGVHKTVAWTTLPLMIAVPATGLLMYFGVTFGGGGNAPMGAGPRAPLTIAQAAQRAAAARDLGAMVWIRPAGPRVMMRYVEDSGFQGFFVGPGGLAPTPRNWPRAVHEGLWAGLFGVALNVIASLAFIALMVSGLVLWTRRRRRRPIVPAR